MKIEDIKKWCTFYSNFMGN